jgi:hypothetical protein
MGRNGTASTRKRRASKSTLIPGHSINSPIPDSADKLVKKKILTDEVVSGIH